MINTLPTTTLKKFPILINAVFYCMNASSERIPVGVVSNVSSFPDKKLEFTVSHFPVLENMLECVCQPNFTFIKKDFL